MAHWTASAKWAAGPALDGQCAMPLALRLSEGLDLTAQEIELDLWAAENFQYVHGHEARLLPVNRIVPSTNADLGVERSSDDLVVHRSIDATNGANTADSSYLEAPCV